MYEFPPIDQVVIHGVGLIGGSIAAAVRRNAPGCRVTGIGRNEKRLEAAKAAGLLSDWSPTIEDVEFLNSPVVVVCLPVDLIPPAVIAAAERLPDAAFITDAGSTKRRIQQRVNSDAVAAVRYVGAHPIAGSEQSGFEFADARLFVNRPCVVIHSPQAGEREQHCCRFWESLGARVTVLDAAEHDRVLAVASHLPHVMAAVIALCIEPSELEFTGTGFADTTRVAAGDPGLWRQILEQNADDVLAGLIRAREQLDAFIEALRFDDDDHLEFLLKKASDLRRRIG